MVGDKVKFKNEIQEHITQMFDEILSYAEVAVPNKRQWEILRSRILRSGNTAIRDLQRTSDEYVIAKIVDNLELLDIEKE